MMLGQLSEPNWLLVNGGMGDDPTELALYFVDGNNVVDSGPRLKKAWVFLVGRIGDYSYNALTEFDCAQGRKRLLTTTRYSVTGQRENEISTPNSDRAYIGPNDAIREVAKFVCDGADPSSALGGGDGSGSELPWTYGREFQRQVLDAPLKK